jgi:hypothetical protein
MDNTITRKKEQSKTDVFKKKLYTNKIQYKYCGKTSHIDKNLKK